MAWGAFILIHPSFNVLLYAPRNLYVCRLSNRTLVEVTQPDWLFL